MFAKFIAPGVAAAGGRGVSARLEHVRTRPVGLHPPAAAQHLLAELPRGRRVAQIVSLGFQRPRQREARLRQRHERHAAFMHQAAHHGGKPRAALARRQPRQLLIQRLVEPAHQILLGDAAAAVVHRHLRRIGRTQLDVLVLQVNLEQVALLHHLKAGQVDGGGREQVDLDRFEQRLALQRPQVALRVVPIRQRRHG